MYKVAIIIQHISNLYKSQNFRDVRKQIALFKRTADSVAAEMYTADERKITISPKKKAMSLLWYWKTKSVIQVQRHYRWEYGEQAPGRKSNSFKKQEMS
jgi:hypothetical protein